MSLAEMDNYVKDRTKAVVFVDLDRTITRRGTFTPFLLGFAFQYRPWRLPAILPVVLAMALYKLGLFRRKRLKEFMLWCFLADAPKDQIALYAADFAEGVIGRSLRDKAIAALCNHRQLGDTLVLVTASLDFYAEKFADALGIKHCVSTKSCWSEDQKLLPKISGENCYGAQKRQRAEKFLKDTGISGTIVAYADNESDLELLKWSTLGVVVNPQRRFRDRLAALDLQIVDWEV